MRRYRLLRLNQDIPQLPHTQHKSTDLNPTKLINEAKKDGETFSLPTVGEWEKFVIEQRRAAEDADDFYATSYCLDNYIWVNPEYLLDMLNALPGCVAYKPDRPIDPIYFKAKNGDGLLLPIRPPRDVLNNQTATPKGESL